MKTITLQKAVDLLNKSVAVILPDEHERLIYPSFDYLKNGDNPFFHVSWSEGELDFRIQCFERDNNGTGDESVKNYPKFDGSNLYFIDEDGEELKVTLLEVMKIYPEKTETEMMLEKRGTPHDLEILRYIQKQRENEFN